MLVYPYVVFAHVLGAVGVFAAIAVESVSLRGLRRADSPALARASMGQLAVPARLGPIAMITTLASGIWMTAVSWGGEPWIVAAMAGLVAMAVAGGAVTGRHMRRVGAALSEEKGSVLTDDFRAVRASAALTASLRLRMAVGIGILALMTVKPPSASISVLFLAAALAAGLVAAFVLPAAGRPRQPTEA